MIEVKTVKIVVGRKELELSINDAKELMKKLQEVFGGAVFKTENHYHYDKQWSYNLASTSDNNNNSITLTNLPTLPTGNNGDVLYQGENGCYWAKPEEKKG